MIMEWMNFITRADFRFRDQIYFCKEHVDVVVNHFLHNNNNIKRHVV